MRRPPGILLAAGLWIGTLGAVCANTFTVTTTAPLGAGSLTAAIDAANAHFGADTIAFDIPGNGVQTIIVGNDALPEITDPVTIDGYTQPGAQSNTLSDGDDAVILIRIDGRQSGPDYHDGFIISAGNSTVRGLALTGFPAVYNFLAGEVIFLGKAIILQGAGNNTIEGNFIGFSSDEPQFGGNAGGVEVVSSGNVVGGTLPGARNICAHNDVGVQIDPGAAGTVIQGNYFGTDPAGTSAMGNGTALFVIGSASQIGGRTPAAANRISANQIGINLTRAASANVVEGNVIGTGAGADDDLANSTVAILISGSNNLIGGLEPGAGNHIGFNPNGVEVVERDADHPAVGNAILSNVIGAYFSKIDLGAGGIADGPTRDDLGDGDTGPNELQNFPIITSTSFLADRTVVKGGLNSTPSTTFTLQFFTETLHATVQGATYTEGPLLETKTVTTDAAGIAYFEFDFRAMPFDVIITTTATDPEGNTSEFRGDFAVQLANISSRGRVGRDDNLLIAGFVVHRPLGGPAGFMKRVLLRALGPSLAVESAPLDGRLANPTLELHDGTGALLDANDDWRSDQEAEIMDTGAAPTANKEAALIADLPDGSYTVQVRGVGGGTGLSVVEVYDLDPLDPLNELPSGRLVNISTRALVGLDENVLIGGLIVRGDAGERVLLRAIGPDLSALEVPNALEDPTLEVRDASGTLIASNDNWRSDQEAEITSTGIAPNDDRDAAALCQLIPGNYTAIVRGTGESSGIALVEIYDLNPDH